MKGANNMGNKILIMMGIILLLSLIALGFFAFSIGIPICSIIGLTYGIKNKDRLLVYCGFVNNNILYYLHYIGYKMNVNETNMRPKYITSNIIGISFLFYIEK